MQKTTLVIMAAGIGSRFGKGIKQLTPVGPSGELIMDYSVHDAIEAGFDKVVFILRKDIMDEFRKTIGKNMESKIEVDYAFQELEDLPAGFSCPPDRVKPWGTGQAVLCCKGVVDTPFAVINADDYYGKEPYVIIHDYLVNIADPQNGISDICCAGFKLGNTLSDHGGVTRGICHTDAAGRLTGIDETKNIVKTKDGAAVDTKEGLRALDVESPVSMNMWGFEKGFIDLLDEGFKAFLTALPEGNISDEFLLPIFIDELIKKKKAAVKVLPTNAEWFGVTYQEDRDAVVQAFLKLVEAGVYQKNLYGE